MARKLTAYYCRHPEFGVYALMISRKGVIGSPYRYGLRTKTKLMEMMQSDNRIGVQPRLVNRSELMHLYKQKRV